MFSHTQEYALRAMVWLAGQDGSRTTEEIARATQVPFGYLPKIVQALGRAGLVQSKRGIGGGVTMVKPPGAVSPLDVINAVDPIRRIESCPLGLESHGDSLCPVHRKLDSALAEIERVLAEVTLADMATGASASTPFCAP
jgi:Rrf2 family protein